MTSVAQGQRGIRVSNVHKAYRLAGRQIPALNGVDLIIDEPGFYGIMGPSGSGKSTLLHLLAALDRPDSGEIEVAGSRLDRLSERELTLFRRHQIGIVFQQFNLISTLNALENVTLPAILDGKPARQRRKRGIELLEQLGLGHRIDHRPDALSGGEQQRVAIARALFFQPSVLYADEPTGNLDSQTSEHVWALLSEIATQRNLIVLMVTHEPSAAAHCRRVFLLRDGRIQKSTDTVDDSHVAELVSRAE
jgi:putative ABC transport system ATP-binding protein